MVCESIYDKKEKGAVVHLKTQSKDEHGDMVFENKSVFVDRASGNFGGSRGPKFEPINPPEDKEPVFTTEYVTSQNQGALYRLSGDKNPLHIDPEYAQKSGFSKPILHGLCSFGFAGRAILHNLCQSDPGRLRSFGAKFMNVVFPGDTLITKGWSTEQEGQFIIRTTNQDGKIILGSAMVETM